MFRLLQKTGSIPSTYLSFLERLERDQNPEELLAKTITAAEEVIQIMRDRMLVKIEPTV